jgi:hypothetical protein
VSCQFNNMSKNNSSSKRTSASDNSKSGKPVEEPLDPVKLEPEFESMDMMNAKFNNLNDKVGGLENMMMAIMNKMDTVVSQTSKIPDKPSVTTLDNQEVITPQARRRRSLMLTLGKQDPGEPTEGYHNNSEDITSKKDASGDLGNETSGIIDPSKDTYELPDIYVRSDTDANMVGLHRLKDTLSFGKEPIEPRGYLAAQLASSNRTNLSSNVIKFESAEKCRIKISKLRLGQTARDIQALIDFQDEHEQIVRIQTVLSKSIKEHLKLCYNLNNEEMGKLTTHDLLRIVAHETKVFSIASFYEELYTCITVTIPEWSKVNPVTHETFYYQQLRLIAQFKAMLGIMLEHNRQFCPKVDTKPFGLILLFKLKNDKDYMRYALAEMPNDKYTIMTKFLDDFGEIVLAHYEVSKKAREMPYRDNQVHRAASRSYEERSSKYGQHKKKLFANKSNTEALHNLSEVSGKAGKSDELINYEDISESTEDSDPVCYFDDDEVLPVVPPDNVPNQSTEFESSDEDVDDRGTRKKSEGRSDLQAITDDNKDQGCLKFILNGACTRGDNCKFSHSKEACRTTADKFLDKLQAYKGGKITKILQRPKGSKL